MRWLLWNADWMKYLQEANVNVMQQSMSRSSSVCESSAIWSSVTIVGLVCRDEASKQVQHKRSQFAFINAHTEWLTLHVAPGNFPVVPPAQTPQRSTAADP